MSDPTELPHRPDVDGLRGVAIGAVVLFQASPMLADGETNHWLPTQLNTTANATVPITDAMFTRGAKSPCAVGSSSATRTEPSPTLVLAPTMSAKATNRASAASLTYLKSRRSKMTAASTVSATV